MICHTFFSENKVRQNVNVIVIICTRIDFNLQQLYALERLEFLEHLEEVTLHFLKLCSLLRNIQKYPSLTVLEVRLMLLNLNQCMKLLKWHHLWKTEKKNAKEKSQNNSTQSLFASMKVFTLYVGFACSVFSKESTYKPSPITWVSCQHVL